MAPTNALDPNGIVTLTTDFGLQDGYAGAMKGVILSRAPTCRLVDITHAVAPQAVLSAAFILETAWQTFPPGTVHLVVVDPGVGTSRRRLAIIANGHAFVGPENGCLSPLLPEAARGLRAPGAGYEERHAPMPPDVFAVSIENEDLLRHPVSATFEGRDVFAPAAAHLAAGGAVSGLGPRIEAMLAFPAFRAPSRGGTIEGVVVHVDHFGNLITDIVAENLAPGAVFSAGGRALVLAPAYAGAAGLTAIVGSSGRVEISYPNGSAAGTLGLGPGDRVIARPA